MATIMSFKCGAVPAKPQDAERDIPRESRQADDVWGGARRGNGCQVECRMSRVRTPLLSTVTSSTLPDARVCPGYLYLDDQRAPGRQRALVDTK